MADPVVEDGTQETGAEPVLTMPDDPEAVFNRDDEGHDYSLDFLNIEEGNELYKVPEDDTADFVGIGSLGHIIRKCFQDLYRPGADDEDKPPPPPGENTAKHAENSGSVEEKEEKGEEDASEAVQDGESTAVSAAPTPREEEEPAAPPTEEVSLNEGEEDGGVEAPAVSEADNTPEAPVAPILPLPYACEAIREGRKKVQSIDAELRSKLKEADALRGYLEQARVRAKEMDEIDRLDLLESTGLLLKSELPRGESHLEIDKQHLQSLGSFGGHLIIASDLLAEISAEVERVRNPPSQIKKSTLENSTPHYMEVTSSMKVRRDINLKGREESVKQTTVRLKREAERKAARDLKASLRPPPPPKDVLPREGALQKVQKVIVDPSEKEVSDILLERMQNKLNFMRNPRFDKEKYGGPSGGGAHGLGNKVGDLGTAIEQPPYPVKEMAFVCEPEKIQFTDYEVGGEYETTISLRNITPVSRRLRLLPPRSEHFAIALVEFPGEDGLVAPGMSVRLTVRFLPDSLADYQDAMICITEQNRFKLAIEAFRPPPTLSIPGTLDVGCALIGSQSEVSFRCTNHGGKGKFRCLPEEDWPNPLVAKYGDEMIDIAPFKLFPAEFSLESGETIELKVLFKPQSVKEISREFVMVCDNCQVKTFNLTGTGCRIGVQITSLGGLPVDLAPANTVAPSAVIFNPVTPGATAVQDLSILNLTPIELRYRWDIRGENAGEFDMTPSVGSLPLNGTVHFDVSFTPDEALKSKVKAFLIVEGVPPKSVDDVDPHGPLGFEVTGDLGEDFDPETAARDVACMSIDLVGAGKEADLDINPTVSNFPGTLLPGKTYKTSVTVSNKGDAEAELRWVGGRPNTASVGPLPFELKFDPPFSVIQPADAIDVNIEFTPYGVGYYSLDLPCLVAHGPPSGIFARLSAECVGPELTILNPEIDFGLLSVGGKSEMSVTFKNLSDVQAAWSMGEVGIDDPPPKDPRKFKNPNSNCRVLFDPNEGIIGPNEEMTVAVLCAAGKVPQRLRASLELRVENGDSSYCRARAEVQSPKVFLRESRAPIDLGFTYIGVPVTRTLLLTNLSNLPADFKWNAVVGNGQEKIFDGFDLTFEPAEGLLSEKEEREILVTFNAKVAQTVDVMFACDVVGMPFPLGFMLKTVSKGLVVAYSLSTPEPIQLKPGEPLGIQDQDETPPKEGNEPSNVRIVPTLDFGEKCPLMTRNKLRLVLRNYSDIPTSYEIFAEGYPGEEVPAHQKMFVVEAPQSAGSAMGKTGNDPAAPHSSGASVPRPPTGDKRKTSSPSRSKKMGTAGSKTKTRRGKTGESKEILGDRHENSEQFRSQMGHEHILKKSQSVENQAILIKGRGTAFVMTPDSGSLPPWGTVYVDVVCYNDMPGSYADYICCKVGGLDPVRIRAKATVVGSPLTLADTCVGLDKTTSPPEYAFGDVLRSTGDAYRMLKVINSGPVDCQLSWSIKGVYDEPPLIDIAVDATGDKDRPVNVSIEGHPPPPPPPFSIDPYDDIVPSYGSKMFRVSFTPPDKCDKYRAVIVANGSWSFPDSDPRATTLGRSGLSGAELDAAGPDLPKCLTVNLGASTIMPRLVLAKEERKDVANFNFRDKFQFVKFSTWSTHASQHPAHFRTISLTNPTSSALTFSFETQPPTQFNIAKVTSSAPKHPLAKAAVTDGPGVRQSKGASGPYKLLIGGTMDITLKFTPPKFDLLSDELEDKFEGDLTATFANTVGDSQLIKLHAYIKKPTILISPAEHRFGAVHVERWRPVTLFISNPTEVDAEWRIQHVPFHRPPKRVGGEAPANEMMPMDEPSVFKFSMVAGTLMGPSLPLSTASVNPPQGFADERKKPLGVTVTFKPETAVHYRSRFRFIVKNGNDFDVLLFGKGSFYEGTDRVTK